MESIDKRGKAKLLWSGAIAVFAVADSIYYWYGGNTGQTTIFNTVEVDSGAILQSVLATGTLNPVRTVQVGSQVSGNIMELLADFNSVVDEGDIIAQLDPAIFNANVSLAEAELERAKAAYSLTRAQWNRLLSLHGNEVVSDAELDEAKARLGQAQATVSIARHVLEKAQLELERCTIVSPVRGLVISRNVDVGQTVAASLSAPILFEIAEDLTQMEINTFVSEADIGYIREGQRVEFRVDAFRNQSFPGKVWQVRNAPMIRDNVVSYDAVVRVSNPDLMLKPGMTAEVTFITDERNHALRIRNTALRARIPEYMQPEPVTLPDTSDWRRVYRLSPSGSIESVAVRIGISDGLHTEIMEGITFGDTVITGLALIQNGGGRSGPSLLQGNQQQF